MECTFEVGQRVVCVDDSDQTVGYLPNVPVVVQDMIYIIREIYFEGARQYGDGQLTDGGVRLRFEGLYRWAKTDLESLVDVGFDHKRFRPVQQIDTTATVAALAQAMREAMKKGRVDA